MNGPGFEAWIEWVWPYVSLGIALVGVATMGALRVAGEELFWGGILTFFAAVTWPFVVGLAAAAAVLSVPYWAGRALRAAPTHLPSLPLRLRRNRDPLPCDRCGERPGAVLQENMDMHCWQCWESDR